MKKAYTGVESSGKNYLLSLDALDVLHRNKKWLAVTGIPRTMVFDNPMASKFIDMVHEAGLKYHEVHSLVELQELRHCDIFIGEAVKYFPASGSDPLPPSSIDFLTQGAKGGINMYVGAQDFSQVHKTFRLLMNEVYVVNKLIGSPRPHATRPPIKYIWGLIMTREVRPSSFKGDSATMEEISMFPSIYLIERKVCELFDTGYLVPPVELPPKFVRKQEIIGKNNAGDIEYHKIIWR